MHDHNDFDPRWERGWRKLEEAARRFGNDFRGWGDGFGANFRIGRMLASGDLRLVALYFIEQQPRHGYDLIKAIEDKSQGFYSPSPGIVYPALTFLEEAGYVTSAADGNKKLYTITDEGRAHLNDNRAAIQSTLDFLEKAGAKMKDWREKMSEGFSFGDDAGPGPGPGGPGPDRDFRREFRFQHRHHRHGPPPDRDTPDVVPEFNEARRDLKTAIADAIQLGEEEQRRVAEILRKAANKIRRLSAADSVDI
jgi:DNA-binding PadR family transcriptional regulator